MEEQKKPSYKATYIAWFGILANEAIYLLVLVVVAFSESNFQDISFEALQSWQGFGDMGQSEVFLPVLVGLGVVSLLLTGGLHIFAERLIGECRTPEELSRKILIACAVASIPANMGLVMALLGGQILWVIPFFGLTFYGKLKFFPGFYLPKNA